MVERSGLRGRGGGGFPTGRKLRAVADGGRHPVVVANGAEGEPASCKDRALLQRAPHLVIDGATVAARAVGAEEIHFVVDRGDGAGRDALEVALRARAGEMPRPGAWRVDDRAEPLRGRRGERGRQLPQRWRRQAGLGAAAPVRAGRARSRHPGAERRDAGQPRARRRASGPSGTGRSAPPTSPGPSSRPRWVPSPAPACTSSRSAPRSPG